MPANAVGLLFGLISENTTMATTKKKAAPKKGTAKKQEDPCWKGYEQLGTKNKNGKAVPNCVPEKKK